MSHSFKDVMDVAYCGNCDMAFRDPAFWTVHRLDTDREFYCANKN